MTRPTFPGNRRGAATLLAAASLLALGIQAARLPAEASRPHASSTAMAMTMAGMIMHAPAAAAKKSGPVLMLHKRVVRLNILNFAFSPATVVVSPGTRVIWTNKDGDPHTVTSTKKVWNSPALDTNGAFARTFAKTGAFPYFCAIHPFMHGTILVKK